MEAYRIDTFYQFKDLSPWSLDSLVASYTAFASQRNIVGTLIFSPEGINSTLCGPPQALTELEEQLTAELSLNPLEIKSTQSPFSVFKRLRVQQRRNAVTCGTIQHPTSDESSYLSPEEWDKKLEDSNCVVIDTRNWYETMVGRFKGSVDLNIRNFSQFPQIVEKLPYNKDQEILIYCTGGIRCEKAIISLKAKGFAKVRQLHGGILNYFSFHKQKNSASISATSNDVANKDAGKPPAATPLAPNWEGECFVFDDRVAVDKNLEPTQKYYPCSTCGQPIPKDAAETGFAICHPQTTNSLLMASN